MGETEEFNTLTFEKKLMQLKDTQESIQGLSSWCLKQRANHKKIVQSWLNVLKRVKVEQRLVLFYLANDVIQYSKRKNYEFVESWGLNLQKATPLVREEKVRHKIMRIFKIWEQRNVYDEDFLSDLTGLLSAGAVKKTDDESVDFQPQQLVNKIKQCTVLESDTDLRLKCIHECPLDLNDTDALCTNLKDRSNKDDVEKELTEGISCVEKYTQALQREIVAREALLVLLSSASQYYSTQRGEVKVVAYAYKNFGARVRALKRKLDDLVETLPEAAPSPPRRDEDVPSPAPDDDLDLPNISDADELAYNIDRTFNSSLAPDGSLFNMGLSSFLSTDNPMSIFNDTDLNSANKIEVINNRPSDKPDFNINDFLNTLSKDNNASTPDNNSVASGTISQKSQDALPGLDLLTPESTGNPPPPTSFYGTTITDTISIFDEPDLPFVPETTVKQTWNSNNWSLPPAPVPPPLFLETPESPPPPVTVPTTLATYPRPQEHPPADVDHRGILPPPPPPPVLPLLTQDVDHRLLPNLTQPAPPRGSLPQHVEHNPFLIVSTSSDQAQITPSTFPDFLPDVDHRNLISLTHQLQGPRPPNNTVDQDYRVPPMVPPPDIVESVDMDLSEDEEQRMYPSQPPNAPNRRNSFNNNKVLVGGDNGKLPTENPKEPPHSAPILPMVNPFDSMPDNLKFNMDDNVKFNMADNQKFNMADSHNFNMADSQKFNMADQKPFYDDQEDNYDEDLRSRGFDDSDRWDPRNQRFPRNWTPRTNFRPQFWPRNGPRPPRWNGPMGPRPQRFW